jgi:hypothetical protein
MKSLRLAIKSSLKNPLVIASLVLGVLGAPPVYFSGIFIGQGQELIGGLLFLIYVVIYTLDALVTLTLLIKR